MRGVAAEADGPLDRRGGRLLGARRQRPTCGPCRIAEIVGGAALPGGARAVLPQGVRGLRQQLRAEPGLAAADLRGRRAVAGRPAVAGPASRREVERAAVRRARPRTTTSTSPSRTGARTTTWPGRSAPRWCGPAPAVVVDVGCGVGRWAARLRRRRAPGDRDRAGAGDGGRGARRRLGRHRLHAGRAPGSRTPSLPAPGRRTWCWRWGRCSTPTDPAAAIARLRGLGCGPAARCACCVDSPAGAGAGAARGRPHGRGAGAADAPGAGCGGSARTPPTCTCSTRPSSPRRCAAAGLEVERLAGLLVGRLARTAAPACSPGSSATTPAQLAVERRLAAEPALADLGKQLLIVAQPLSR